MTDAAEDYYMSGVHSVLSSVSAVPQIRRKLAFLLMRGSVRSQVRTLK